jgi:hypothetical protein
MKGHMHPEAYRGFRELLKREVHIDCGCKFNLLFRTDLRKGPWQISKVRMCDIHCNLHSN